MGESYSPPRIEKQSFRLAKKSGSVLIPGSGKPTGTQGRRLHKIIAFFVTGDCFASRAHISQGILLQLLRNSSGGNITEVRATVVEAMFAHAITALSLFLCLQGSANPKAPATATRSNTAPTLKILFFTASWCEPCRAVHPILEKFAHKHKKNVELVIVDFDSAKGEDALWDVQQIPVVIVVSAEDEVLLRYEGARKESLATLESALDDLLKSVGKGLKSVE